MSDVTLEQVYDKICRVDEKVDKLENIVTEHRVSVEHRLTQVETKGALFGALLGALTGGLASFFGLQK